MIDRGLELLERYFGYKSFRKGQDDIIKNIVEGNDVLAIMPTGGGKSICYQIPALMLEGMTVVISPLISLMKDQVDTIKEMGIEAAYINSSLTTNEFKEVLDGIRSDRFKIIYVAPERLESYEFLAILGEKNISQVAIDEAHCVSQWGHDFRTSYRKIPFFINSLKNRPIITAFTATATNEVREDIINILSLKTPKVFISGFDRENLKITIVKSGSKKDYLLDYINNHKEDSGIIYAATRKEVDAAYTLLLKKGFSVGRYHAGLSDNEREKSQEDFIYDRVNIMVATNAFGMGIDKSNIRYVIHYNMPKNIESYYQEIGRAGRDGLDSECVLLFTPGDVQTQKYLIEMSIENPERKNNQYKMLQYMVDMIHSNDCYRRFILNYFGDEYLKDCNNCSNCESEGEIVDRTLDAQKVLSCIYRMKRSFGSTMIVDVLRASKNKKLQEFKFNELSTYGIMKEYSKEDLKNFINTLISHGYMDMVEGTYPVIRLNDRSIKVLKGEEQVKFKEIKVERVFKLDDSLYEELRTLRRGISEREGVPPYIIFPDVTLKDMYTRHPVNKEQMLLISGVGEVKYNKYGEEFEKLILKYLEKNRAILDDEVCYVSTDERLLEELIKVRNAIAKKENQLPQAVIAKNTLKEISGRYPRDTDNLKDITGLGPKKIERYSEKILEIVNNYVLENGIEVKWRDKKRNKLIIDGEHRKPDEIAIDMLKEGKELQYISQELEVSISTVLGYVTDYLESGRELDFNLDIRGLYTEEERALIINECRNSGYSSISSIKRKLPDNIKYESIRAVILDEYYLKDKV